MPCIKLVKMFETFALQCLTRKWVASGNHLRVSHNLWGQSSWSNQLIWYAFAECGKQSTWDAQHTQCHTYKELICCFGGNWVGKWRHLIVSKDSLIQFTSQSVCMCASAIRCVWFFKPHSIKIFERAHTHWMCAWCWEQMGDATEIVAGLWVTSTLLLWRD